MRPSWSSTWDALVIRAMREHRPELLRDGRRVSVGAMSMVLTFLDHPQLVEKAVAAASAADRNYLAEYLARGLERGVSGGVWDDEITDPGRCRNLRRGILAMKAAGWEQRLSDLK